MFWNRESILPGMNFWGAGLWLKRLPQLWITASGLCLVVKFVHNAYDLSTSCFDFRINGYSGSKSSTRLPGLFLSGQFRLYIFWPHFQSRILHFFKSFFINIFSFTNFGFDFVFLLFLQLLVLNPSWSQFQWRITLFFVEACFIIPLFPLFRKKVKKWDD